MSNLRLTRQRMFNKAVSCILRQGRPGREDDAILSCTYYSDNNSTRCAVGWLLTDAELAHVGDAHALSHPVQWLVPDIVPRLRRHKRLLVRLQLAHDVAAVGRKDEFLDRFRANCREVAAEFGLSPAACDEYVSKHP